MQLESTLSCKVVIVGDTAVGKTSIIDRFSKDIFSDATVSTFGCTALEKNIKRTNDGKIISMRIWDTAGQEQYRSLSPVYFRDSSFAVATLDVSSTVSIDAIDFWIKQYRSIVGDLGTIVLAANKIDTIENESERSKLKSKLEKRFKLKVFLVSAKENIGIQELFQYIADSYQPRRTAEEEEEDKAESIDINSRERERDKKSCC